MNNTQIGKQEHSNKPKQNNRNSNNRNNNRNRYKRSPKDQDRHLDQTYRDLLKKLRFVTYQFVSFVEHSTEEQLLWSLNPEAWNIKHQIGHICQYLDFQNQKIASVIALEPFLESLDKDEAIKIEEFNNRSLEILLARFRKAKKNLFMPLYASTNEHWQQKVEISSNEISLDFIIEEINNYFEMMLDDVFMNLQRYKVWYIPENRTEAETVVEVEEVTSVELAKQENDIADVSLSNDSEKQEKIDDVKGESEQKSEDSSETKKIEDDMS